MCLKDWAKESGVNYMTLRYRVVVKGLSIEEATGLN